MKGLEPQLYECLAATFRQDYPIEKLTIFLCVDSIHDTSYPLLQRLLADFPKFDARILVAEEDPNLSDEATYKLGPNPKIRNLSRGYREAKGDLIWICDCNVWVPPGVGGRMVDKLCGLKPDGTRTTPYKFVHQLPFVVDSVGSSAGAETRGLLSHDIEQEHHVSSTSSAAYNISSLPRDESLVDTILRIGGGRLEEMFMSTAHAKFYTAINTVAVAPCIVGKSNMFRRSHLNFLTSSASPYSPGIDFFSDNICEDHLIGDILWRKKVQEEIDGQKFYKHGMVFGDLCIQPMAGMPVREYIARRVRWLRVRKWTVALATAVEPGTESLLCSIYASFALTTLPWSNEYLGIPHTWLAFCVCWFVNVSAWICLDIILYNKLHSRASVEMDADTPTFVKSERGRPQRPIIQWAMAWLGREMLALPIWCWAVLGGTTVVWRGRRFRVGMDMMVREIEDGKSTGSASPVGNGRSRSKDRVD